MGPATDKHQAPTHRLKLYVRPDLFKGNKKLHISNAPFRTTCIVSGINTSTEKLADMAEYEVQQYVLGSPSYIRDTIDFVNKLKEKDGHIPYRMFSFFLCLQTVTMCLKIRAHYRLSRGPGDKNSTFNSNRLCTGNDQDSLKE